MDTRQDRVYLAFSAAKKYAGLRFAQSKQPETGVRVLGGALTFLKKNFKYSPKSVTHHFGEDGHQAWAKILEKKVRLILDKR